jgi:hypothetical protein
VIHQRRENGKCRDFGPAAAIPRIADYILALKRPEGWRQILKLLE